MAYGLSANAQVRLPIQVPHRYPASRMPTPFAAFTLTYYGGPVISNVQVVAVFWTASVDASVQANVSGFYSTVTISPWMDVMSQYSTAGISGGSNQLIGHGSYSEAVTITPSKCASPPTACSLNDTDIQAELKAQINAGHLPTPQLDAGGHVDTLYMIYFPPGVTISLQGSLSCQQFCAYHETVVYGGSDVPYGVIPEQLSGGCASGCGGSAIAINNVDSVCSHELAEAVTDPAVGLALTFAPPLAWYDNVINGGEIGDICNGQQATTTASYTVQKLWSNKDAACVASTSVVASATTTALSSSALQARFRRPVTLTATVTSSGVAIGSSGNVVFMDGATTLGTAALNGQGQAALSPILTRLGLHQITAAYQGSSGFTASTSPTLLQYRSPKPH